MITLNRQEIKEIIINECDKNEKQNVQGIRRLVLKSKNRQLLKEMVYGYRQVKKEGKMGIKHSSNSSIMKSINRNLEKYFVTENIRL